MKELNESYERAKAEVAAIESIKRRAKPLKASGWEFWELYDGSKCNSNYKVGAKLGEQVITSRFSSWQEAWEATVTKVENIGTHYSI